MNGKRHRVRGSIGLAAARGARRGRTRPRERPQSLADEDGLWEPVSLENLRGGETVRVVMNSDLMTPEVAVGQVMGTKRDEDQVIVQTRSGPDLALNENRALDRGSGEIVGSVDEVSVLTAGAEHARTFAANRFFPDGYAVYDWQTKGFVKKGFVGQVVFETLEEAERLAEGEQQVVVRLARPDESPTSPAVADGGVRGGVRAKIRPAICPTGDRCDAQAESLAADLYDHVHAGGHVGRNRVNSEISDMIRRNFEAPNGEKVVVREAGGGSEVVLEPPDGSDLKTWDFWDDVMETASSAPSDTEEFIRVVSDDILDMAESALHEAEQAVH